MNKRGDSCGESPLLFRSGKIFFFLRSRTLAQLRALAARFLMFILCRAAKNEPRKRAKGCAFGNRPPAVLTMNGGDFCSASFLHLRGIYPTPQMG
jgi:hypothetical protein